jgi:Alginate export
VRLRVDPQASEGVGVRSFRSVRRDVWVPAARVSLAALLFAVAPAAPAGAQAPAAGQAAAKKPERPPYVFLQNREDWSTFQPGDDLFDPIKHVKLNDSGSAWVSFGGRGEARFESWNNFNFGAPPAANHNDTFVLSRLLVHGDLHLGERFRLYAEGKTAQSTDRDLVGGRRTLDMDTLDLQQLFVDVVIPTGDDSKLVLRPGRQMLLYGAQRIVSPLPWGNTLRTWDGATAAWISGPWTVTGLFTAFVPVDKTDFNQRDDDELLYGVYARRAAAKTEGLELYALGSTRENVTFNGTTGDSDRYTFGLRDWGPIGKVFDYEFEGALQYGEVGSHNVQAGFASAELGWKPDGAAWSPRYFLGLDYATGDDSTGGSVQTFDQLYPLGHAYFGFIDAIGRQNVAATTLGGTWKPAPKTGLRLTGQSFWLADTNDAIYNAGGGITRAPGSFDHNHIGYEVDLLATQSFGLHLEGYTGYSHFFAGQALSDSGPDDDVDFFYLGLKYTF